MENNKKIKDEEKKNQEILEGEIKDDDVEAVSGGKNISNTDGINHIKDK